MEQLQNYGKVLSTKDKIFNHISKKSNKLLLLNTTFIIFCVMTLFCLFYQKFISINVTAIIIINLLIYCLISFYAITQKINLEITKKELEKTKLHNKTLENLNNSLSGFKHDFSNIITALGGLIYVKDIDGLKNFYDKILIECNINNNLSALNPSVINHPAIYNIIASKYHKAEELGITVNLQTFVNFNDFTLDIYNFCRILGILLDNAIEASHVCEEKLINIEIRNIKPRKCQIVTIENTYSNKDIDISRLSEKGYTSKKEEKECHGIGLWQVSKILRKYPNVILDTSKNEEFFKQELVIYY